MVIRNFWGIKRHIFLKSNKEKCHLQKKIMKWGGCFIVSGAGWTPLTAGTLNSLYCIYIALLAVHTNKKCFHYTPLRCK